MSRRKSNEDKSSDESVLTKLKPSQKQVLKAVYLEAETQYSYVAYEKIITHAEDKIAFRRQIGHLVMNDFLATTNSEYEEEENAHYYLTDKGLEAVREIQF